MRGLILPAVVALLATMAVQACRPQEASTGPRSAVPAPPPRNPERAAAEGAVADLEAAIAEARSAINAASTSAAPSTDEQRLRLSDARRAVVGANVALQKAREALGRDDDAGAVKATLGVAEHLRQVVAKVTR